MSCKPAFQATFYQVRGTTFLPNSWGIRQRTTQNQPLANSLPTGTVQVGPGRPHSAPRLTPCRLAAALARDPRSCGYQATSWTVPLLRQYLQRRHGITISARTLRRRLHEADYRWKRPRYVYAGRAAHLAQKKGQ